MKPDKNWDKDKLDKLIAEAEEELAEAENNPKQPDTPCYQSPGELKKLIKDLKKLSKDKE